MTSSWLWKTTFLLDTHDVIGLFVSGGLIHWPRPNVCLVTFTRRDSYGIALALYALNCFGETLTYICILHDDVIKWKHLPRNWSFVREIHRSPVNSPHKGQWRGAMMFSLICVWINGWVNNCEAGDLRRFRAHYDVSVMDMVLHNCFFFNLVQMHLKRQEPDYHMLSMLFLFNVLLGQCLAWWYPGGVSKTLMTS